MVDEMDMEVDRMQRSSSVRGSPDAGNFIDRPAPPESPSCWWPLKKQNKIGSRSEKSLLRCPSVFYQRISSAVIFLVGFERGGSVVADWLHLPLSAPFSRITSRALHHLHRLSVRNSRSWRIRWRQQSFRANDLAAGKG